MAEDNAGAASYLNPDGTIDAGRLASYFSLQQHQANADRYFATIADPRQYHLRKPYAELNECCNILVGLSAIFRAGNILPGHRVLDFGCGTGWLSQIIANMRCDAVGLDVSASAIDIAENWRQSHPMRDQLQLTYKEFDGRNIPFDDVSFDRVICFDSFHHVSDQNFLITEFGRILKPGGIALFHEPGPTHASSPQSQLEMKNFMVIEGDIVIERLWSIASACGFDDAKLIVLAQQPTILSIADFNAALADAKPEDFYHNLGKTTIRQFVDKRIFLLKKSGSEIVDSRSRLACRGAIEAMEIAFDRDKREVRARLRLENTGRGAWLPSGAALGSVNVGVRLLHPDGSLLDGNYSRHQVIDRTVDTGDAVIVEIVFHMRYRLDDFIVEFDLVAELVTWFSELGCHAPRCTINSHPTSPAEAASGPSHLLR
jgi:2-polyprenyl-3-methyl-5-hydroxy-6-metoxy-1,4-benzoquinol methylase